MRTMCVIAACVGTLGISLAGCGSSSPPPPSTVSGRIQQETFVAPVKAVKAQTGTTVISAPVDAAGNFKLVLSQGNQYQFLLSQDTGDLPLVVRASADRLDTTIKVKSGGASVNIGGVQFWDGAASSQGSAVMPPSIATKAAAAACDDEEDDDDGDHECVDGIEPSSGQECDGGPGVDQNDGETNDDGVETTDAAARDKLGLSEFNAPDEIGCDDDDGDGETADD